MTITLETEKHKARARRSKSRMTPEQAAVQNRIRIETRIVKKTVEVLLAEGYLLSVDDGGDELAVTKSRDKKVVLDALQNTDEDTLIIHRPAPDGKYRGVIHFVYGNDGYDVIQDNSASLEEELAEVTKLADKLELESAR